MAAVLGGMTLLQLAQLIAAIDGGALSLLKIHDELRAKGAGDTDVLSIYHQLAIKTALSTMFKGPDPTESPAQAFIDKMGQ